MSFEVQQLVAAELVLEADANPTGLPKWCAFQYRNGGVVAHLDHDLRAMEGCRRDFDVVQERVIYSHRPNPDDVLNSFRAVTDISA